MPRNALDDAAPDVQWNAAVALARHGRSDGLRVLGRMLDRDYVQRHVDGASGVDGGADPVAAVMVSGLQAVGALRASELRDRVTELSRSDASLRVREAALRTLELLEPAVADGSAVENHG